MVSKTSFSSLQDLPPAYEPVPGPAGPPAGPLLPDDGKCETWLRVRDGALKVKVISRASSATPSLMAARDQVYQDHDQCIPDASPRLVTVHLTDLVIRVNSIHVDRLTPLTGHVPSRLASLP